MADSDARRSGVSRRTFRPVRGRRRRQGWDGERVCQSEADAGSHGYRAAINGHGRDAGSSPGPTVTRCISVPVPVSSGSNLVPRASALLLGVRTLVYGAAAVVKVVRRRKAGTADDGEDQPGQLALSNPRARDHSCRAGDTRLERSRTVQATKHITERDRVPRWSPDSRLPRATTRRADRASQTVGSGSRPTAGVQVDA